MFQRARQTRPEVSEERANRWREALIRLLPMLERRPACIVLDEFQWLANYRREMVCDLNLPDHQIAGTAGGLNGATDALQKSGFSEKAGLLRLRLQAASSKLLGIHPFPFETHLGEEEHAEAIAFPSS